MTGGQGMNKKKNIAPCPLSPVPCPPKGEEGNRGIGEWGKE